MDLIQFSDNGTIGFKCKVICPVVECGRKIGCIYKQYARGRKRRNDGLERGSESYRRAVWYFPNLQSHLELHEVELDSNPSETNSTESIDADNEYLSEASASHHDIHSHDTQANSPKDGQIPDEQAENWAAQSLATPISFKRTEKLPARLLTTSISHERAENVPEQLLATPTSHVASQGTVSSAFRMEKCRSV